MGSFRRLARLRRVLADRRAAGRRLYLAGDWVRAAGVGGEMAAAAGRRCAEAIRSELD